MFENSPYPFQMSVPDSENKYQATVRSLVEALQDALRQACNPDRSAFPALLLLYGSMDIVASLSRPIDRADTSNKVFKAWIDEYMLPGLWASVQSGRYLRRALRYTSYVICSVC